MPVRQEQAAPAATSTKKSATYKEFEKIASKIPGLMESIKEHTELEVSGGDERIPVLYVLFEQDTTNPDWQIKEFLFAYHTTPVVGNTHYMPEVVEEKKLGRWLLSFHKI